MVVTDIDGTLLGRDGSVSTRAPEVIAALRQRGIGLVLSTGRPPRTTRSVHKLLDLTDPVVTYNGAFIFDPISGDVLYNRTLDRELALTVVAEIRRFDPSLNVGLEIADTPYVDHIDERIQERINRGLVTVMPVVGAVEDVIKTTKEPISKLHFIAPADVRRAFAEHLTAAGLMEHVHYTSSGYNFAEVMARGGDKGTALREIAGLLAVDVERTMALGDADTDVPMLKAAGLGVAMGDAPAWVQQAADLVADPQRPDAWAAVVEEQVLERAPRARGD